MQKEESAFNMYNLMLNSQDKSQLKSIVAHCLAARLRWIISDIPVGIDEKNMFDSDLYGFRTNVTKMNEWKSKIEQDQYLSYIVNAIKYAAGEK